MPYITVEEAVKLQRELAKKVITEDQFGEIKYVAGIDVSHPAFQSEGVFYAAVCILSFPDMQIVEEVSHFQYNDFPYIPGLLAFRESPIIIEALKKVTVTPDILIVDGHGISHPRRLGIASHIGVLTDYPTIGSAKSIMVGKPERDLLPDKGDYVGLIYKNEIVGNMVRSKNNVQPIYVSIGHKVSLQSATEMIFKCITKYRLPEPIRAAHHFANVVRRENIKVD